MKPPTRVHATGDDQREVGSGRPTRLVCVCDPRSPWHDEIGTVAEGLVVVELVRTGTHIPVPVDRLVIYHPTERTSGCAGSCSAAGSRSSGRAGGFGPAAFAPRGLR